MPIVEPVPKPPVTPTGTTPPLFTIGPYQWNHNRLLSDSAFALFQDDNGSDGYSHRSSNSSNSSLNGHETSVSQLHTSNSTITSQHQNKSKPALPAKPPNLTNNTTGALPALKSQTRPPQRQESFTSISSTTSGLTEKEYSDRIAKLQLDSLIPLKEDVADWLNRILGLGPGEGEEDDEDDEDDEAIRVENFNERLENGVIVCRLAKLIEKECRLIPPTSDKNIQTDCNFYRWTTPQRHKTVPNGTPLFTASSMKCWDNARPGTFFARDNVSNFLNWCRMLGVNDAVLFETEDLVSHVNLRNVVLCLLEVARIACTKHHFSPAPGLVEFEQEIDREIEAEERRQRERAARKERKLQEKEARAKREAEIALAKVEKEKETSAKQNLTKIFEEEAAKSMNSQASTSDLRPEVDQFFTNSDEIDGADDDDDDEEEVTVRSHSPDAELERPHSGSDQEVSATESEIAGNPVQTQIPNLGHQRTPSPANSVMSCASSVCTETALSSVSGSSLTPTPVTSELDHKVMQIAKSYYGKEARQGVQRLSEGKYKIANRIVFVRLLKARHVMVRVGGGWTTLSHFLARHGGDPNQQVLPEELMPMDTKPAATSSRSKNAFNMNGTITPVTSSVKRSALRSNSTHTLVIPFQTPQTPLPSVEHLSITSGRSSRQTTASIQSDNSIVRSTPVSRRSSVVSSPEPLNSCSSGYSTGSGSFARPFSAKCMTDSKIPMFRSRLPSLQNTPQMSTRNSKVTTSATPLLLYRSRSSFGFATPTNLMRSSSTTVLSNMDSHSSSISKSNLSRYPNYLKSSQHITTPQASNFATPTNAATITKNRLKSAGSVSHIPILTTPTARKLRASSQKLNQL